jgi:N-acetylglucosaminyldiphosphoundecaprenol N-acetyl-beta-D-mannosaminyltransferase
MPTSSPTPPAAFRSCGVRIDALPLDEAANAIVTGRAQGAVHLCNAYTLSLASRDPLLADVLERGSLNLPDGMPLVWIAKRIGVEHLETRVYGPDLMAKALDVGRSFGVKHYLYGSTDDVLAKLTGEIDRHWPGADIVGAESPPFTDDPLVFERSLAAIEASGATVVWVGLGTPKQDVIAQRLAERHPVTFVAVGAAFDFLAGTKKQAPPWAQRNGLEWGYRLATEPGRLWKRYLIGNTRFVVLNVRERPALEPVTDAV